MNTATDSPVYFLLVDDHEQNLVALEALLRRDGLVILCANSGREALELLLKHEVALALVDVQMPEMDGFELAELMRGSERTRRVPIIFLTAAGNDCQRRFRGYESGAVDFLTKPVEIDILRSKANVFFELYCQRQEVARQRDELAAMVLVNQQLLEESQQRGAALKESVRRKDEFLAMLAHELRNPLAPIRSGLDILALNAGNREDVIKVMQNQLSHVVRLVDDLLDASRIMLGKVELRREPVELSTLINRSVLAIRPMIDKCKQSFSISLPSSPIWLNADPVRIVQVMDNLLTNASKYTENEGSIHLSVTYSDGQVEISVQDSGIGIDSELLPKVFELFTQASRSLDRSQGGLGIGLTLVQRIVQLHGGEVSAHSEGISRGSNFVVRLPTIPPPVQISVEAVQPQMLSGLRVLVVDDNRSATWLLAKLLTRLDVHQVEVAHDGIAAVAKTMEMHPDIVILDIGLPGMDGYEVGRTIRAKPDLDDLLLVALTGYGQEEDRATSRQAGFDEHLVKPPSVDQLRHLLAHPKLLARK
jgi:signal transduction histidine kinase